ncbi:MAG: deoxyribonuclease IV [Clostridiales bacterium]|jgi:deoxyribonuclease-4|nr:deoxyribonuclease IV [Clostridiales bacterium]
MSGAFIIGCHLSFSKGFYSMGADAVSIRASAIQFFTRNPRGGKAKEIDAGDVAAYNKLANDNGIKTLLAHASYTLNLCSADKRVRDFAEETMADDLKRMEFTPHQLYNFHPGSHVGQGVAAGIDLITAALNKILSPEQTTMVLLETMAGKGSEIGARFEELRAIIDGTRHSEKLGVCLDTCHVYDAGYDIVGDLDGVLEEFDGIIGIERLKAIHINDSKNPFGSHKDRHEKIGQGSLGISALARVINHPALRSLPFLLETPNELEGYAEEIALLKKLRE